MFLRMAMVLGAVFVAFAGFADRRVLGQQVKLLEQKPDPHGFPRPSRGAGHVPLRTSLYFELGMEKAQAGDRVDPESVTLSLQPEAGEARQLLKPGRVFATGCSGRLSFRNNLQGAESLAVYLETDAPLRPSTKYTATATARSRKGAELPAGKGSWSFTTEESPNTHELKASLDLGSEPVVWQGAFFSGFCNVSFCTSAKIFGSTYDLMAEARKEHPRAWSFQRDFWLTGTELLPKFMAQNLPNIVVERETRHVTAIEPHGDDILLRLGDVFGAEQYGIQPGRPLRDDYHPDDEVRIADGTHDARSIVKQVDDPAGTVLVKSFPAPKDGWRIAYAGPLPQRENPDAPGLFPPGGCYLSRYRPAGTPAYYWGRLDKEWDLAHKRYGRRVLANFADAPIDLSRDGRSWTTVKDYAEWHEAARTIAGHIIDRYGKDALTFVWSIFNEPDLGPLFWRSDWNELQTYYDYTVDAILRAFEDRGYDSNQVFIGGLELGGIFGVHLKLKEFLAHCSPTAQAEGALPRNMAVADTRLDGKRSRRVEELARAHGGKGTPCDFVSIHSYNQSELMAAKLIRAKEMALEIDPDYYVKLWVNSHESCPDWAPPPDTAAADSYLGNGYFPTWCADVSRRLLQRAAADPRYGFGETILTTWPPNQNFTGANAFTRVIQCDDDGDGKPDRRVTVPMPIFHALSLLSDLHDRFWVVPEQTVGGNVVSGFAARDGRTVRVLLYAQNAHDTQARSEASFAVALDLKGMQEKGLTVREYRFDKDHNSYFRLARTLRDRSEPGQASKEVQAATEKLGGTDRDAQRQAVQTLAAAGSAATSAVPALLQLSESSSDPALASAAREAIGKIAFAARAYPRKEVEQVQDQARLRETKKSSVQPDASGRFQLKVSIASNGLNFLVIQPAEETEAR